MPTQTMTKSQQIFSQLQRLIPGGVNSAGRAFKAVNRAPIIAERGEGDILIDVDGNRYIDYCGSWGALIHGHAHPNIVAAATAAVAKGSTFGLSCPLEAQLARLVIDCVPSVEQIRFVSSGTEATMSAARLARGFTGRDTLVKFTGNYHGHADFFLVQAGSGVFGLSPTSSSAGIPSDIVRHTACLPYNDIEAARRFLREHDVAGVILEPVAGNMGVVPAKREFLQMLRDETTRQGALLIFDEVISGFRVALGGAQELYGIVPDLTCFGKILGGGFPAAAFGGRREIMQRLAPLGDVYQAGTLSGNPVAMAAGIQSLSLLLQPGIYGELARKADVIAVPVRERLRQRGVRACLQQVGSMMTLFFGCPAVDSMEQAHGLDKALFAKLYDYLLARGIFIPPSPYEAWFVSTVHQEEHLTLTRDHLLGFLDTL